MVMDSKEDWTEYRDERKGVQAHVATHENSFSLSQQAPWSKCLAPSDVANSPLHNGSPAVTKQPPDLCVPKVATNQATSYMVATAIGNQHGATHAALETAAVQAQSAEQSVVVIAATPQFAKDTVKVTTSWQPSARVTMVWPPPSRVTTSWPPPSRVTILWLPSPRVTLIESSPRLRPL